jgi:hypothetical protein
MVLVTVLQRDIGVRYNPDLIDVEAFFADSGNVFLHGVVQTKMGSCASLPVPYTAVGRRLGYPLKLVKARSHLFARWEDGQERFNIEATDLGLSSPPDDCYRRGRYAVTPGQEEAGGLLRSMTPRQELAEFLGQRGFCRLDNGQHREAAKCFAWACAVAPANELHAASLWETMRRWDKGLRSSMPRAFPPIRVNLSQGHFPGLPREWEEPLVWLEVMEGLLRDRELHQALEGSRTAAVSAVAPKRIDIDYPAIQFWRI